MSTSVGVWFRAVIAVVAVGGIILFSTSSMYSPWKIAPLKLDGPIGQEQHENYWTIPGEGSSLLPLTNFSSDIYIDLGKLRQQVRQQNKECRDLTEDPSTMFKSRPSNTSLFTRDMDLRQVDLAFTCGGLLYPEYLTVPPREELYPFEAFYLSEPPLWDESTVASHNHSTIRLFGPNKTFVIGDIVSLVIKMFDKKGRPKLKGGDRLKVWLKDVKFQHSISANITDFNNGTYLATTVLAWAGTVRVMATLRQPREFFRALAYVHRTLKSTISFFGAYSNSKASECVPCSPIPQVPGYPSSDLCNLTLGNGSPWFCGRPRKRELNCSDYSHITYSKHTLLDMPVTPAEHKLLKEKPNQQNFLSGSIVLNVEATKSGLTRLLDSNVPCNKVSPRATWHQSDPTGYFYHKVWKPFLCFLPDPVSKVDESCLKNVTIINYGDSNSREAYFRIKSRVKCNQSYLCIQNEPYHAPKICENKQWNFSVQHISHSSPFHAGWNKNFLSVSCIFSPERLFSLIPTEGRYIIILSHYLHYTTNHISVYERALIAIRESIIRLLKRNPHVLILLRGPHVAEYTPYVYYLGDVWGQQLTILQKKTFRGLQDRIIYFPTWDITVASEDVHIHPSCNDQLSDIMFQLTCGRDQ